MHATQPTRPFTSRLKPQVASLRSYLIDDHHHLAASDRISFVRRELGLVKQQMKTRRCWDISGSSSCKMWEWWLWVLVGRKVGCAVSKYVSMYVTAHGSPFPFLGGKKYTIDPVDLRVMKQSTNYGGRFDSVVPSYLSHQKEYYY